MKSFCCKVGVRVSIRVTAGGSGHLFLGSRFKAALRAVALLPWAGISRFLVPFLGVVVPPALGPRRVSIKEAFDPILGKHGCPHFGLLNVAESQPMGRGMLTPIIDLQFLGVFRAEDG